jgi:hypothetical protein
MGESETNDDRSWMWQPRPEEEWATEEDEEVEELVDKEERV